MNIIFRIKTDNSSLAPCEIRVRLAGYLFPEMKLEEHDTIHENILTTTFEVDYGRLVGHASCSFITVSGLLRLQLFLSAFTIPVSPVVPGRLVFNCYLTELNDPINLHVIKKSMYNKMFWGLPYLTRRMLWGDREHMITIGGADGFVLHLFSDIYNLHRFIAIVSVKNRELLKILPEELFSEGKRHGAIAFSFFAGPEKWGWLKYLLEQNIKRFPIKTKICKWESYECCTYITAGDCRGWHAGQEIYKGVCGSCICKRFMEI